MGRGVVVLGKNPGPRPNVGLLQNILSKFMSKTIGLDIGGTKVTGAVLSGNKIIKELTVATAGDLPAFKSSLGNLVKSLSAGKNIRKLGIGIAGLVEPDKCTIVRSPNIPYLKNLN